MATEQQRRNLRRGGAPATPAAAARAREAKSALAAEDARLAALAGVDPLKAYDELHATMTRHVTKLLRAEERAGAKPARETTDRLREYRQLTERLIVYRSAQGRNVEAEAFLESVMTRVESLAPQLADLARPIAKPPARSPKLSAEQAHDASGDP